MTRPPQQLMSLSPGTRLGHYAVIALLGEGGMGQVWQATDTQLNRQVALKILPDAFAEDPDRLARFTREAQILASLNHPNIAAISAGAVESGVRSPIGGHPSSSCVSPSCTTWSAYSAEVEHGFRGS